MSIPAADVDELLNHAINETHCPYCSWHPTRAMWRSSGAYLTCGRCYRKWTLPWPHLRAAFQRREPPER